MRRFGLVVGVTIYLALTCFASGANWFDISAAAQQAFVHPGVLGTEQQIRAFSALSNMSDRAAATYRLMEDDARSSSDYRPRPLAMVDVVSFGASPAEKAFKDDAMAAYLNAMLWVRTGDPMHREKAIEILDAWATTFQSMTSDVEEGNSRRQPQLEAAWALPMWVNAAEIIRYYGNGAAGWKPENIATFNRFVDRLFSYSRQAMKRKNNWGAAASMAAMAIGVYQNHAGRYTEGLNSIKALMPAIISDDGMINELYTRDCGHPQYSLAAFVQAAAIAGNQGDSSVWLFGQSADTPPLLARGLEYMSEALIEGSPARDCHRKGRIGNLESGYGDIALQEYRKLGVPLPNLDSVVQNKGPDRSSYQFLGWSSAIYSNED